MSAGSERERIERHLVASGHPWLVDSAGPQRTEFLDLIERVIQEFIAAYQSRFPREERPDPCRLLETNPIKGLAFFETSTLKASDEMRIMIWRILQGCEIKRIAFHYEAEGESTLSITLQSLSGEEEPYAGDPARDFPVLRHISASTVSGCLLLQGYYAFKRADVNQ